MKGKRDPVLRRRGREGATTRKLQNVPSREQRGHTRECQFPAVLVLSAAAKDLERYAHRSSRSLRVSPKSCATRVATRADPPSRSGIWGAEARRRYAQTASGGSPEPIARDR